MKWTYLHNNTSSAVQKCGRCPAQHLMRFSAPIAIDLLLKQFAVLYVRDGTGFEGDRSVMMQIFI